MKLKSIFTILLLLINIVFVGNGHSENSRIEESEVFNNNNDFIIIKKVNFDNHSTGIYTNAMFNSDWGASIGQPNTTQIQDIDGRRVMANFYPQGKFGTNAWGNGGGGLDQWGRVDQSLQISEIYLSYRLKFETGFHFNRGGKLPGVSFGYVSELYGAGAGPNLNPTRGSMIFMMWTSDGKIIPYLYHHSMPGQYGDNFGIREGIFKPGTWQTLTIRVVGSTPGVANGIFQAWLDDNLIFSINNIQSRTTQSPQQIGEIILATFMGGGDPSYGPNKDQYMWMDDFYLWQYSKEYLDKNPNVARGFQQHSKEHKLITPFSQTQIVEKVELRINASPTEGGKVSIKTGSE